MKRLSERARTGRRRGNAGVFTKLVGELSRTREDVKTWFDYLDLDDHVIFGGKQPGAQARK